MRRTTVAVLVAAMACTIGAGDVFAAGPSFAVPLIVTAGQAPRTAPRSHKKLIWGGAALIGGGIALKLAVGRNCEELGGTIKTCSGFQSANVLGLGMAAAGGALLVIGVSKRSQIGILPTSVTYRWRF